MPFRQHCLRISARQTGEPLFAEGASIAKMSEQHTLHRKPLLQLLANYCQQHPGESSVVDELASFVEANTDCFERTLLCGHVTGSAWLVSDDGSKVLLTHHKKLNRWLQLGGHADGSADILQVALREAKEESGLADIELARAGIFDIDIHAIPARKNEPEHLHYDVRFALQAKGSQQFLLSDESNQLAWVPVRRLAELVADESMLRMAEKWCEYRK